MEPGGSLSCSQEPATGLYPWPYTSSSYLCTLFISAQCSYYLPIYV